ncbi:hypothetical protein [Arthrobacter sp. TMN-50]
MLGLVLGGVLALGRNPSEVWNFAEWTGYTYVTDEINLGYADTLGDFATGGLGICSPECL